jgi:excisionase family DNA binding protein
VLPHWHFSVSWFGKGQGSVATLRCHAYLNFSAEYCLELSSFFQQGRPHSFGPVRWSPSEVAEMRKSSTITAADVGVLAVSPAEAGRLAGIGRTTIYNAISSGELKSVKIGARRLVTVEALRQWLLKHEVRP